MGQPISRSSISPRCARFHICSWCARPMPFTELCEEQSAEYRDEVLPPSITARLAVEAGVRGGWDRYVGPKGDVICLDRFGASAPGDVALKNLGFNVENVVKHARDL